MSPNFGSDLSTFWSEIPRNGSYHIFKGSLENPPTSLHSKCLKQKALFGEMMIANFAKAAGWQVILHQFRRTGFELDLVILKNRILKIIEVKTRFFPKYHIDAAITSAWMNFKKIKSMRNGAQAILHMIAVDKLLVDAISCDLIAVDVLANNKFQAYRWPNACHLEQTSKQYF